MIYLTKEDIQKIIEHCQKEYPKEACGILAGMAGRVSKVYKMKNTSDNPQICYFMEPGEQLRVFKEMRNSGIEMSGIYHSHSKSPAYPSPRDCEMAYYPEAVYLIISLKDFNNPEVRVFKIIEGKIEEEKVIIRKNVLFVCIQNSCRSQMAEGIVNNLYREKLVAYSAGSKPSGIVNPKAIEVMKEIGIDISAQKSKGFSGVSAEGVSASGGKDIEFDDVITLGCGDMCPIYPAKQKLDWQIDDPKNKPIEFFRKVRDEIEKKIKELGG